jgi:hypothetical protein
MTNNTPKFTRLIQIDYPSAFFFVIPALMWGFFLIFFLIGLLSGGLDQDFFTRLSIISSTLMCAAVATVLFLPLLYLRYRRFKKLFTHGIEVTGKIEGIGFNKERGAIEVSYRYQGEDFNNRSPIFKGDLPKDFKSGNDVLLVVDPVKPEKAYIKDLYL